MGREAGEPAALGESESDHAPAADDPVSALYRAHAVALVRTALLLVGDRATAEDVVQEAFCAVYRGWWRLREPDRAAAYLRTAVVNGCRTELRRRRVRMAARTLYDPPVWSAEAAAIDAEDRREVLAQVARLPRRQREVLVLRYYLGLADQEIADTLGVSRGTVSATVSRAMAALAGRFQEES
jgi:RNA polymerase sigma-70 factor (sigma-E family)